MKKTELVWNWIDSRGCFVGGRGVRGRIDATGASGSDDADVAGDLRQAG